VTEDYLTRFKIMDNPKIDPKNVGNYKSEF